MATIGTRLAKAGNLVVRPLGALAAGLTRMQQSLYQPPSEQIPGMSPTDWPSPLQPVRPFGEPNAQPLGMNILMGQNLMFTPRPDSRFSAADLQLLARYPLARICITNVIDTISSSRWKIQLRAQPGEERKAREPKDTKDATILKLTEFMNSPDGEHDFAEWIRPFLNDMLTIDAGAYLLRKNADGIVYEWRVMQGAYITRLVDANGYTPRAPAPAYQQLWDGIPRLNLSADQLIYRPRNIVYEVGNIASSLYGYSPTEQLADELEVGIQRLRYVKAFYKDGAIPNVLWVVPSDTQPDIVQSAMKLLNTDMAGNLESRRQFRFAQGFRSSESVKDDLIKQFDEPKLSDDYDDQHTRRICFGFGVSAQRLIRMMTRATATSNQEAAEEEGMAPFIKWAEDSINYGLQRKMGYTKYEFRFNAGLELDPQKQAEIDATDLGSGKLTVNEVRLRQGLDPFPLPQADQLGKWIATGWAAMDAPPPAPEPPKAPLAPVKDPPEPDGNTPDGKKKKLLKSDSSAVLDPGRDSIRTRGARSALFGRLLQFFYSVRSNIVIVSPHSKKMRKGQDDDEKRIEQIVDAIMAKIPWDVLPSSIQPAIQEAALEGAQEGLAQAERAIQTAPMTVSLAPTPVRVIASVGISETNKGAMDYAKDRAAELVGMRWVDGELVPSPNAAMTITEPTRNMIRKVITDAFERETPLNRIVEMIQDAGVFSEERAQLIADTEIKFAQSRSNLEAWKKSGVVKSVRWVTSSLHDVMDECDENEEAGAVPLGSNFPSGVQSPPAHPQCRCVSLIAELIEPKKKENA